MSQKHEVDYSTKKWGISEEQLAAAHKVAGPMAERIEAHLKKTGIIGDFPGRSPRGALRRSRAAERRAGEGLAARR